MNCEPPRYGDMASVAMLHEADADVDAATDDSVTPLLLAIQNGHEAVPSALITGSHFSLRLDETGAICGQCSVSEAKAPHFA